MNIISFLYCLVLIPAVLHAHGVEVRQRIKLEPNSRPVVSLTLDACSGGYDAKLLAFLIKNKIPATLFLTKKWMDQNSDAVEYLKAHLDLFDIENHGERHVPAVVGARKTVYGIEGQPDLLHLRREIDIGAQSISERFGKLPRWYRAATAKYDQEAVYEITKMGYRIGGFSVNADEGATLSARQIIKRLNSVRRGDIIIAHMNKPVSANSVGLAEGLKRLSARGFTFVRLNQIEVIQE